MGGPGSYIRNLITSLMRKQNIWIRVQKQVLRMIILMHGYVAVYRDIAFVVRRVSFSPKKPKIGVPNY